MKRITFIGAGSYGFTYKLAVDILHQEPLLGCELVFMDIDGDRLANLKTLLECHCQRIGYNGKAQYTTDMAEALKGADIIINLVKIGMESATAKDMDIPKKYGLFQTVGDTCGVAGISRGLRTMIFNRRMLKTAEAVASPHTVVISYTNPQSMLVTDASAASGIPFIGLCHSVQGMEGKIRRMYGDVAVEIAGINHMAWVTKIAKDGRDIYPQFREDVYRQHEEGARPDEVAFNFGSTRVDMMRRVGYMVTESSEHFAEYVPYYLRTEALIKRYDIPIDKYQWYNQHKEGEYRELLRLAAENRLPESAQSVEYCAGILSAMVTNVPYKIYANVMNTGLITNLPSFACVETACFVDRQGVHPCVFGDLPQQLVPMCSMEINVHKLASDAVAYNDRDYVYWAMMADPIAHSVLDLDQMRNLTDELLEAQKEYLDGYFMM